MSRGMSGQFGKGSSDAKKDGDAKKGGGSKQNDAKTASAKNAAAKNDLTTDLTPLPKTN